MSFLDKFQDPDEVNKIIEYVQTRDESLLTEKMVEKLERVGLADDLIRKYGSRRRVIELMRVKYPELSEASLIRDFYDAKKVFNTKSLQEKEYDRELWYQWALEMAMKALNALDFHAFEKMGSLAYKFGQFYLEEDDDPQAKIDPHNVEITFDPDILGVPKIENLELKKKKLRQKLNRRKATWYQNSEEAEIDED
jgi:hypothetical protein